MKINYGFSFGEVHYLFIKRKIFLSPYLVDRIIEYKIFCFNGEPKYIVVSQIRGANNHIYNYYDLNWTLTDINHRFGGVRRDPNVIIEKPKYLNLMLDYARKLSEEFAFVRVDLYEVNDTVYLSEMTFAPSNNQMRYNNEEKRIYLGSLLDINKIKPYLFNN